MTTNHVIGTGTSTAGHELRVCSCGWSKVTPLRGLRIHQGRMKCLKQVRLGPCIDHYLLREGSSQSNEAQRQDTTHSPPSINIPVVEDGNSSMTSENLEPVQMQHVMEKKIQGYRPHVKWPKSCSKKEWGTVNADLSSILEGLQETAEKKLERMGDLFYEYGVESFGAKDPRKKKTSASPKSRRQHEIERLVKERESTSCKRT